VSLGQGEERGRGPTPREFRVPPMEAVHYGPGAFASIGELSARHTGRRAFAVISGSLVDTWIDQSLRDQLGGRLVGVYHRAKEHVPRACVLEAAEEARAVGADLIISVGGGTAIDCAKAVTLCLAADIEAREQFDDHRVRFTYPATLEIPELPQQVIPHIAVPTTLSGAEHTELFGVTDEKRRAKDTFSHRKFVPRAVVLDPVVAAGTPEWLWAASGMRAVDHAVEGILSAKHMPFTDALGLEALALLTGNLRHSARNPDDVEARTNCMLGTWLSIFALTNVGIGLSHGLGRQLSAQFGILHGLTSAIMLPEVMAFNAEQTRPQLRRIAAAMGADVGLCDDAEAAVQAVATMRRFIESLGVPHTLSAVGARREELDLVVEHAMSDPAVADNPRQVTRDQLLRMLQAAW